MKKSKAKPEPAYDFAVVVWRDSCVVNRECDDGDLPSVAVMATAGFLVRRDERSLTLAFERATVDPRGHWRGVVTIPAETVVAVHTVKLPGLQGFPRSRGG